MRNRNEDKFGLIVDEKPFNSLDEAGNYVNDLKDKLKRKAEMEEFPITCSMPEDRLKFIEYGISLMTKENLPFDKDRDIMRARAVMWLIANGYTFSAIVSYLKKQGFGDVAISDIRKVEKEGMVMVKRAIDKVKGSKVPVLGG